jgi:hypothetical protein
MKITQLFIICAAAILASCANHRQLQSGDLIFCEGDGSNFSEAIEKVTPALRGKSFTHVGLVQVEGDSIHVLEATFKGVVKTPLNDFRKRKNCHIGRLKKQHRYSIAPALRKANALLGKAYDYAFDLRNDRYYCSELIYLAFTDSANQPLFAVQPMTFNDAETGKILPNWQRYFDAHKLPVPEGELGLNPNSVAHSEKLEEIFEVKN